MASITLDRVCKAYQRTDLAVDDVSLEIGDGEFMVLVGPSGCGKSSLLRMIAGLEIATSGRIEIGGLDVTDLEPPKRDVAMVFQNYALYPHLTVRQNIGFGLRVRRQPKELIDARVAEVAVVLGLEGVLDRRPAQLSGGQRQRVAMGRAMVRHPAAFLMDEPLSNLDAKLRSEMRTELARMHERLGVTTVFVTHDQVEAMTLGSHVAVLNAGRLQQVDTPDVLFAKPNSLFVAAFIGSPQMNLIPGTLEENELRVGQFRFPVAGLDRLQSKSREVVVGLRPSDFEHGRESDVPGCPRIGVRAEVVERLGEEAYLRFLIDARAVGVMAGDDEARLVADRRALVCARVDPSVSLRAGDDVELTVRLDRVHLFSPDDGTRISSDGVRPVQR